MTTSHFIKLQNHAVFKSLWWNKTRDLYESNMQKKKKQTRLVAKLSQLAVKRYRAALVCNGVKVKAKPWYTT